MDLTSSKIIICCFISSYLKTQKSSAQKIEKIYASSLDTKNPTEKVM